MGEGVMMSKEIAELQTAFMWTCPQCGRDHFVRAIHCEMSEEEQTLSRIDYGEGEWVMMPDRVTCPDCKVTFKTKEHDEEAE